MAYDLKKEEDVQQYLHNLHVEYSFGCYSENNPEACHLLGEYYEAVKKEFEKATKLFKSACDDHDFARSCHSYASRALVGKGMKRANIAESQQYFMKSCDLNNAESCCNGGVMTVTKIKDYPAVQDVDKGLAMLEKGCELGSANACYYLSGFYVTGTPDKTVPGDFTKAFKYATMGCDLNNMFACSNLSLMYKRGDGVDKDEEMSEKIKKKAIELQNQHNDNLTVNFQRGPNT